MRVLAAFATAVGLRVEHDHEQAPWQAAQSMLPVAPVNQAVQQNAGGQPPPCACQEHNSAWMACPNRPPRCVFMDLGANDGRSYKAFRGEYVVGHDGTNFTLDMNTGGYPKQQCDAYLVEANPNFTPQLNAISEEWLNKDHAQKVHPMGSHAVYCCEGTASFTIDADQAHNHWGSSMNGGAPSVQGDVTKVSVPMINLNKWLYENTIPDDWVVIKMDIEGAEYEIIPSLAKSQIGAYRTIDVMYVETHHESFSMTGTPRATYDQYVATLLANGVSINANLDTPMFFADTGGFLKLKDEGKKAAQDEMKKMTV